MKRRVLIVSPFFAPSAMAGVHRARILANGLPAHGWEPVIVCVDEAFHGQKLDPELAGLVRPDTQVIKTPAWPVAWSRRFGLGDVGIRGYRAMKRAVSGLLKAGQADLLMISVLPGFPMVMGPALKKKYSMPLVLDFQDPWVSAWGRSRPFASKSWLAHRLAEWFEPAAVRAADRITSVSEGTNHWLRSLYPDVPASRFRAIPIGVDPADFDALRASPRACRWLDGARDRFKLSYVGNVWPGAEKTLEAFLAACGRLKKERPELFSRLRLTFVGTSNQPDGSGDWRVLPAARAAGVEEAVSETPERVPYLDALNILEQSDALLMLGSDEPHYTASKLYPCLLSGRPVMAVIHEESSVCETARRTGGVRLVTYGRLHGVDARRDEIFQSLVAMIEDPAPVPPVSRAELAPVMGWEIARAFARVFDEAIAANRAK